MKTWEIFNAAGESVGFITREYCGKKQGGDGTYDYHVDLRSWEMFGSKTMKHAREYVQAQFPGFSLQRCDIGALI